MGNKNAARLVSVAQIRPEPAEGGGVAVDQASGDRV